MTYLNSYTPNIKSAPLKPEELNADTPPKDYDYNFIGGRVREMRTKNVVLRPMNPFTHAKRLSELLTKYPQVNTYSTYRPQTYEEVLQWMESVHRRNPTRITFAVYNIDVHGQAKHQYPPIDTLAGYDCLIGFQPDRLTVELGLLVFPPWQGTVVASEASGMLQAFAFNTLGCYYCTAYTNIDNIATQKLGRKLGYSEEYTTRSDSAHLPDTVRMELDRIINEDPGIDIRDHLVPATNIVGSLDWHQWREVLEERVIESWINITSPQEYTNKCTKPSSISTLPTRDLNMATPAPSYDFNFAGAVKELKSRSVLLAPFLPSEHGKALYDRLKTSPEVLHPYATIPNSILDSLEAFLEYFERLRRDEKQFCWILYDLQDIAEGLMPEPHRTAGFVVIKDYDPESRSMKMGPFVILPKFQSQAIEVHAGALVMEYAFAANPDGLGVFRFEWKINEDDHTLITLVSQKLGFHHEGHTKFVYSPGYVVDPSQVKYPMTDRRGRPDQRQKLIVHRRWVGSVLWDDWKGGVKERIERVLDS